MADQIRTELLRLRAELHKLVHSQIYAYAMGHGCTIGSHPIYRAVLREADDLRARIRELEP
jgi:hypothetical protein